MFDIKPQLTDMLQKLYNAQQDMVMLRDNIKDIQGHILWDDERVGDIVSLTRLSYMLTKSIDSLRDEMTCYGTEKRKVYNNKKAKE